MTAADALFHGHVTNVAREIHGDELAGAALAGATVLTVLDTADYDEDGGTVRIDDGTNDGVGSIHDYLAITDDPPTLTLTTGLAAPLAAGTRVDVWDTEAAGPVLEWVADVVDDANGDVIQATVEHSLVDLLASSVRAGITESVVCELDDDDLWSVTRVLGRSPEIDGEFVVIPGGGGSLPNALDDIYAQADEIAAAAQEAANIGTAAQATANGKNTVTYSADPPGATPNSAGDVWFQRTTTPESPTRPVIIAQYEGQGGTTWESVELSGLVIAYIDAGIITAGSAFVNALQVLTNFTLGDEDQDGVIQSYGFADPETTQGVLIHKGGIVAKGGYLAAPEIVGGTVTGVVFLTDGFYTSDLGVRIDEDGIYAKGGTFVGSSFSGTFNTNAGPNSRQGFLNEDGLTLLNSTYPTGTIVIDANGTIYARGAITTEAGLAGNEVYSTSQGGTSAGDAEFGNEGRIRRKGSTLRIKRNINPMTLKQAEASLAVESVWYQRKDETDADGTVHVDDTVYPGFIAEQADEAGATGWVIYDSDGQPNGIRYSEFAVAHNVLIRQQQLRIGQLETAIADLTTRLAALEGAV